MGEQAPRFLQRGGQPGTPVGGGARRRGWRRCQGPPPLAASLLLHAFTATPCCPPCRGGAAHTLPATALAGAVEPACWPCLCAARGLAARLPAAWRDRCPTAPHASSGHWPTPPRAPCRAHTREVQQEFEALFQVGRQAVGARLAPGWRAARALTARVASVSGPATERWQLVVEDGPQGGGRRGFPGAAAGPSSVRRSSLTSAPRAAACCPAAAAARSSRRCCSWKSSPPSCSPPCSSGSACRSAQVRAGACAHAWRWRCGGVGVARGAGSGHARCAAAPCVGRLVSVPFTPISCAWPIRRLPPLKKTHPCAALRLPRPRCRRGAILCGKQHGVCGGGGRCVQPGGV